MAPRPEPMPVTLSPRLSGLSSILLPTFLDQHGRLARHAGHALRVLEVLLLGVALGLPLSLGLWGHVVAQGLLGLAAGLDLTRWNASVGINLNGQLPSPSTVILGARMGYLREVANRGITVNCVSPGFMASHSVSVQKKDDFHQETEKQWFNIPLGAPGDPVHGGSPGADHARDHESSKCSAAVGLSESIQKPGAGDAGFCG